MRPATTGPPWRSPMPAMAAGCHDISANKRSTVRPSSPCASAERGLEAEHARRRLIERQLFFVCGVRRVVGGDGIDGAVGQAGTDRRDIAVGAQAVGSP